MYKIVNKKNKKSVVDFKTNQNGKIEMIEESHENEMRFSDISDVTYTCVRLGKQYEVKKIWN